MILKVFCLRDRQLAQFANPMFQPTAGVALRNLTDALNSGKDGENPLAKHPADFELFELGEFDSDTGLFSTGVPKSVICCDQLLVK